MAAMARLNRIWCCNTISSISKFKLYTCLVTSILLYGCETSTLLADSETRIQALETKCLRKLLGISYLEQKTKDWVWSKIQLPCGSTRPPTSSSNWQETETCMVQACHMPCLQNHPAGHLGRKRCPGRWRNCCMENIKEWTSLPMPKLFIRASCWKDWKRISAELPLRALWLPNWSRDWTELN